MKIDWENVWKDFTRWFLRDPTNVTNTKWQLKIQSLVEQQLRKKVKRRKKT